MSTGDRPDVLGTVPGDDGGTGDRPPRGGWSWRALVAVVAAALVALLALRSGLLSAPGGGSGELAPPRSAGGLLVIRSEGRLLVEAGDDWAEGPELPGHLSPRASLVPVIGSTGRSVLVGVAGRTLFSIDPSDPEDTPTPLGRARSVVSGSGRFGGVLVDRGDGQVVEVDAATGAVRDPAPFPGQPAGPGWRALGLLSVPGAARSLLLGSSGTANGDAATAADPVDLVLAAPARPVQLGTQPEVRPVATVPRVLALGPDSVLAAPPGCSADGCRPEAVRVVTVTRDDVLARDVAPPPDRAFTGIPLAGGSVSNLLVVRHVGGRPALARVVAGGAATLLVRGSPGVDPAAGLVDDLDGTAYLVVRPADGSDGSAGSDGMVRAWAPARPALARSARAPAVPPGAVLVCGCG